MEPSPPYPFSMRPVFGAGSSVSVVLGALLLIGVMSLSADAQVCGVLANGQVVFGDSSDQCTTFVPLAENGPVMTTPTGPFTTGPTGPFTTPTGRFTTPTGPLTTSSAGPFTTGSMGPVTTGPITPVTPQMSRRR